MARLCEDLAATLLAGDQLHDALQPALLTSLPGVSCLRCQTRPFDPLTPHLHMPDSLRPALLTSLPFCVSFLCLGTACSRWC